jgi:hypothetical protein
MIILGNTKISAMIADGRTCASPDDLESAIKQLIDTLNKQFFSSSAVLSPLPQQEIHHEVRSSSRRPPRVVRFRERGDFH